MAHANAADVAVESPVTEFASCVVRRLMEVHLHHHHSQGKHPAPPPFTTLTLFLDLIEQDTNIAVRSTLPNVTRDIAKLFKEVVELGLEGEVLGKDIIALDRPITPYMIYVPQADASVTMSGISSPPADLEDMLDIPPIPSSSVGYIAYFCRNESFRDLILWRWAVKIWASGRMEPELRLELRGLFMSLVPPFSEGTKQSQMMMDAGILESLYIH